VCFVCSMNFLLEVLLHRCDLLGRVDRHSLHPICEDVDMQGGYDLVEEYRRKPASLSMLNCKDD
jgi:hypothetical protein